MEAERPLRGRRVLITRAPEQAQQFACLLRDLGAEPVALPTLAIVPPERWDEVDATIVRLTDYDCVLFTSTNAVRFFFERLDVLATAPPLTVAAVGPATADALRARGVTPRTVAAESTGEGLFAALEPLGVRGRRFLLPRAERGRDELPRLIAEAGGEVEAVTVYRTVDAKPSTEALDPLRRGEIDVVTFASPSAVERFAALAPDALTLAARTLVAVIGPTTREACERRGLRVDVQPEQHTIPALARAIADRCQRRP